MSNEGATNFTVIGRVPDAPPPKAASSGFTVIGRVPDEPPPQPVAGPAAGPYDALIQQAAQKENIDPVFLHGVMTTESSSNPNAMSPKGASGLMGIMPGTARDLHVDPTNPEQAIFGGAHYLRQLLDRYNQHYPTAAAAYNWGMGNVDKYGVDNAPLETRNYVYGLTGQQIGQGGAQALSTGQDNSMSPRMGPPPTPMGQDNSMSPRVAAPPPDPANDFTMIGHVAPENDFTVIGQLPDQQEDLPWYSMKEVPGAFGQGISDAAREAAQTASGQAFQGQPAGSEPPRSFMGGAAYGLAHSFPLIGGALAGAAGGEAVAPEAGPVGPMVGAALGMGGTAAFQALKPGYDEGIAQGMDHDAAVNYSIKRAVTEGGIAAATAPLYEIPWVKSALGRMLITSFGTQPAVGAATRVIEPAITGDKQPTGQELLRGAGQDIVGGLALGVGHHVLGKALPKKPIELKPPPPGSEAPPPPENSVTEEQITQHAQDRLAALDAAEKGTAEQTVGDKTIPATPARELTDKELSERKFLQTYAEDPYVLAQGYGASLGPRDLVRPLPEGEAATQEQKPAGEQTAETAPADTAAPLHTETVQAPQTGDEHGIVSEAGHPAVDAEATATSQKSASDVQLGGQQAVAGDVRDQAGALRTAEVHGPGISAEATRPGGDVQAAGIEAGQPAAAVGLEGKPARPEITVAGQSKGAGDTIRTDYNDAAGNHIGYSIHDPETKNINTIRVNEDMRRQGYGESILRHLVRTGDADKATAGSYEAYKLNEKVGGKNEAGGNKFTFGPEVGTPPEPKVPEAGTVADQGTTKPVVPSREVVPGQAGDLSPQPREMSAHNQAFLDAANAQIERLKSEPGDNRAEIAKLEAARDDLLARERPAAAEDATGAAAEADTHIDTITAARPEQQALLDAHNQQLDYLHNAEGDHTTQIENLTKTRNDLLPEEVKTALAKRPRPQPKPLSTEAPAPLGAKKNFLDYKFQNGTPIYRDAFVEHAKNVLGYTDEKANLFADRAISAPLQDSFMVDGVRHPGQVEILRSQVQRKYGFTDVTIDPKLHPYETRNMLLDLHRAIADMMHSMSMPNEMASLNRKVKLELGPTAKGRPFGSYTYGPGTKTILVNGRASVFGHEWMHAFDHDIVEQLFHLAAQNPGKLATELGRAGLLDPNNPLTMRMGNLLNALFHKDTAVALKMLDLELKAQEKTKKGTPTLAAQRAQKQIIGLRGGAEQKGVNIQESEYHKTSDIMGGGKGVKNYWTEEAEMLARAGEAYLARIIEDAGLDPRGVVMPDEAYASNNDARLRLSFPKLDERTRIFAAFDHLMDGYRDTLTAGSIPAARALRDGLSDPRVWGRTPKNAKAMGPLKELVYRVRHISDTLAKGKLTDPNRPDPGARNAWQRAKIAAMATFHSRMGLLEGLYDMVPDAAKIPLQKIMDRLGHTVGSGRYTGWATIEERTHVLTRAAVAQYTNVMRAHGFDPDTFSKEQGDHLRHVLTTGEDTYPTQAGNRNSPRVPIDPNIIKVAGPLRSISDRFFQMLRDAGIKVGYARNGHFMRIYDNVRAHADPIGFVRQATILHKLMFDTEVGQAGDNPDRLLDQWNGLVKDLKQSADPATQAGMKDLQKTLNAMHALENDINANGSTPAKDAELYRLQQEAEYLAMQHHDDVGNHIAKINADNWLMELRKGYADDWDKTGPGGNFLNKRTLPPEADQIMRDYMITDPMTVLPHYYESAARKIAYAERFGANGEKKDQLINEMIKGGAHSQDVAMVRQVIDSVSGKTNNDNNRGLTQAASVIHAGASLGMMARAPYSMMMEPFVIALSQGNMRAGFKSMLAQFSNVMRTSTARERAELADWLGVTTSKAYDDVLMNRTGADYSDSPMIGKFMSRFYRATWMTQWTNANRRSAMVGGDYMLTKWSRDILRGDKSDAADAAHRVLNELGVAPELHEDFAKWKVSLDGMPNIDTVESARFGQAYAQAMRRIIDRSVIDPKKMDRPLTTDNKWLGLLWQFQSFNYGFQRNVLDPMLHRWGHAYDRGYQRGMDAKQGKLIAMLRGGGNSAWQVGHMGAIASTYVGINILSSALRQYIFNNDDWNKHEEAGDLSDYLLDLAMSRSGLSGTLDPVIQVATNLRYNQDLSSLLQGPGVKWYAKNFYDVFSAVANPSGEQSGSNLRAHEGVKALYNLIGTPLAGYAATQLSNFGPLGVLAAGAADQYVTAPQFAENVATAAVGPKGATLPQGGDEGDLGGLDSTGGEKLPGLDESGAEGGGSAGISDAQGAGAVPWGILDDFIAPAWKAARPLVSAIPGPLKAIGAAGALGYAGYNAWDKYEPYREQPAPQPNQQQ